MPREKKVKKPYIARVSESEDDSPFSMIEGKFEPAPEAEQIGNELIPDHHKHLTRDRVTVRYLYSNDPLPESNGRTVLAKIKIGKDLLAYFAGQPEPFYVIIIDKQVWTLLLSERQKRALIDHELCHTESERDEDDELKLRTRGHDLEEFAAVIQRHGQWSQDIELMLTAAKLGPQLSFDDIADRRARTGKF